MFDGDICLSLRKRGAFFNLVRTAAYNWMRDDHRELLRGMTMTICDLAAITKPWEVEKRVSKISTCSLIHTVWSFGDYLKCCHWLCCNLELSWISWFKLFTNETVIFSAASNTVCLFLFQQGYLSLVVQNSSMGWSEHCGTSLWFLLPL